MTSEIYKGYLIEPIFEYSNGKADFHVFPDEGKEQGWMEPRRTLVEVKATIDEIIEEADITWGACISGFVEPNQI